MVSAHDATQQFAAELVTANPVRLALAIARIGFPDLDADVYLRQLEAMSEAIAARVWEAAPGGARALALIQAMRLDLGLRGNTEHYYDASNSYLNVVIERRTGLPIMLSLILVAIGQRLGLVVDGAGFPGHFMARYEDDEGIWFLDPFHGAVMTSEDVPAYFAKLFGQSAVDLDAAYYLPVPATAWAQRILNNLHTVYLNQGELPMLAKTLPLMLVLEPMRQELWQEFGLVEYRRGELVSACRALRRYFYLLGHVTLNAPLATVTNTPLMHPPRLAGADLQLWNLLEEIETARMRWN